MELSVPSGMGPSLPSLSLEFSKLEVGGMVLSSQMSNCEPDLRLADGHLSCHTAGSERMKPAREKEWTMGEVKDRGLYTGLRPAPTCSSPTR